MNTISKFISDLTRPVQWFFVAVILIGGAYMLGSCGKKTELDKFRQEYEQFKTNAKAAVKHADSLETEIKALTDSAKKDSVAASIQRKKIAQLNNSLGNTAQVNDRLQHEIDSLKSVSPDTSQISLKKDSLIKELRADSAKMYGIILTYEKLDTAQIKEIGTLKETVKLANFRGDSLKKVLDNIPPTPKDPDKWIFGLKKPTRVEASFIGAIFILVLEHAIIK